MKEVFTHIYETNGFGSPDSRSGPGSTVDRAETTGPLLLALIKKYQIKTMLDAPCGDLMWMKEIALPLTEYVGVDIVEDLIQQNRALYADSGRSFEFCDLTRDPLPRSDLIFCRDCLVHLSYEDIFRALRNFKASESRFLLATNFLCRAENTDIQTGLWRPIQLTRAPFCLPHPLESLPDWCPDPAYGDKSLGLWDIEKLPPF